MTARVIQGFFIGGRPRVVAQPSGLPRPPGPPVQAFAGRPAAVRPSTAPAVQCRPLLRHTPVHTYAGRSPVPAAHTLQTRGAHESFTVDPARLGLASSGGQPLPDAVRAKMEAALGADFSNVRVHVGPQAERIGAIAFTVGTDIYFAPGQFQPGTMQGQQLLGHELTHVVQQRQGRVHANTGSGVVVVQDRALEAEADRLGNRAAAHRVAVQLKAAPGAAQSRLPVVQRKGGAKWSAFKKQERKRQMDEEHDLLWRQRAEVREISHYDETFFQQYMEAWKRPVTVYRGNGIGVTRDSLADYVRADVNPKPGAPEINFYGVVQHTHSNATPGGMVSTTSDINGAIEWATEKHSYGLVWEIELSEYIDVNYLLSQRNFRNRYEGQHEFLIPRAIRAREVKAVSLYSRNGVFVARTTYPG